ncbi:hypothetical protein PTSG_09733 [Salpingoeca rosetta]|uniref:Uncharacterized protein n=1 Tax=Salpingoeca rosetta (strain ATCC 50818 / BSB-021) TaxID=946362 RepID=F2UNW4_SALR5|nr:uncharacterized protein PTSG_09733 [Salpingoeca rosetta]EGD79319.1 hypothetical protein PTSG_09733 [Salpingoeca rosetta]|eukprot:XP_004989088.1 hypothetical protein PTSG_09733 [Salpingoeca rosetta]
MTAMKLAFLVAALVALAGTAAAEQQSCAEVQVTTSTQCNAQCDNNCACSFVSSNDLYVCSCTDTQTSATVFECSDFDSNNFVPSADQVRQYLIALLPDRCQGPVKKAINQDVVDCILNANETFSFFDDDDGFDDSMGDDDDFYQPDRLAEVCDNTCIIKLFRAINILVDSECLPAGPDDDTPLTGDDDPTDDDFFGSFGAISGYQALLGLVCTKSSENGEYCGQLIPVLQAFEESPGDFGAAQCMQIVNYGNCLGSIRATLEAHPNLFGVQIDAELFVSNLNTSCAQMGVTGVSESAEGTESPSNISSSAASAVSGVVAFVAAAIAAVLLV